MTTIHFPLPWKPEQDRIRRKDMSIKFTKKIISTTGRGRVATEPRVRVAGNGQLGFNSLAMAVLSDYSLAVWGTDMEDAGEKRKATTCQLRAVKAAPKGWTESECVKLGWSKDKKNCFAALSPEFKVIGYDYKTSQSQSFPAEVDEKTHTITFSLPVGSLTPPVKKPRNVKAKTAPNGAVAAAVSKANQEIEDELLS